MVLTWALDSFVPFDKAFVISGSEICGIVSLQGSKCFEVIQDDEWIKSGISSTFFDVSQIKKN